MFSTYRRISWKVIIEHKARLHYVTAVRAGNLTEKDGTSHLMIQLESIK